MRIFKMVFNGLLRWFFCHFQHFMLFLYFKNKTLQINTLQINIYV